MQGGSEVRRRRRENSEQKGAKGAKREAKRRIYHGGTEEEPFGKLRAGERGRKRRANGLANMLEHMRKAASLLSC